MNNPAPFVVAEDQNTYTVTRGVTAEDILAQASAILMDRMTRKGSTLESPEATTAFLKIALGVEKREVFAVIFLDNRHRVISFDKLFYGTIDGASVYPREVVRAAINHNAAAVILAHNHPSGVAEPSQADQRITDRLREALALIDVRVLDHIIVADNTHVSFADRGLV